MQQPLLSQDQLAMSSPGEDDIDIDACEDEDENVEDIKDILIFNILKL